MTIQIPKISSPAKKYHKKHHPKYHPTLRHFFREQKGTQNAMSHLGVGRIGSYPFRQLPRRFSKLADFTDHRTWFLRREKSCQNGNNNEQQSVFYCSLLLSFMALWHHPLCGQFPTTRQAHDMPSFFNKQSSAFI